MNESLRTGLTENFRADEAFRKVNRCFRMLMGCNQALLRASKESELTQKICSIIVEQGGYLLAWVGFIGEDEEKETLFPAAHVGLDEISLDRINILIPGIRSGQPFIVNHIPSNPGFVFMREISLKYGFGSYITLPLISGSKFLGALNIYAAEPDSFDEEEVKLLIELEENLAYGITALRVRQEQQHAVKALLESEKKYQTLFEESQDVVFFTSPQGRFLDINNSGVELFGYSSKEEMLKNVDISLDIYVNVEDRDAYFLAMKEKGYVKDYELALKRKDGKKIMALVTAASVNDEEDKIIMVRGILRDITKRKMLEAQLLQAQKMESIGRLAGGIAHDFNNLLTTILGYSELIKIKLPKDNPLHSYINHVLKSSDSAKLLIQQILAFSRKALIQPKVLQLNSVIDNFKCMLVRILGEDIKLEFVPEKDLGSIKADPHQIEQIIMNLTVNSRDAMPQGGNLVIETRNVELDSNYTDKYSNLTPGQYVLLSITDTGCGMDEQTLTQIFEPFFTTKEKGIGTGLGLSTVYGIVKQNDGHVNVYSEIGIGTVIKLYFPRLDEPAEEWIYTPGVPEFPHGAETILVVEDEDDVRSLTVKILSECGYKVWDASDAQSALSIWNDYHKEIDLVLTDVIMPGQSGHELAKILSASKPAVKIVYMTGYSDYMISHHGTLGADTICIQKPFVSGELLRKIKEALN